MHFFPMKKSQSDSTQVARWDPFEEMSSLNERMTQLFSHFGFNNFPSLSSQWVPMLDAIENDEEIILKMDVPGMENKDIKVEVDDGNLIMRGERQHEKEENRENYVHIERGYGAFSRSFPLPSYADQSKIKATCKNGVLQVVVSKIPGQKAPKKSIAVN